MTRTINQELCPGDQACAVIEERCPERTSTDDADCAVDWAKVEKQASASFNRRGGQLPVVLMRGVKGTDIVHGVLVDLSRTGARFTIDTKIQVEEVVHVTICVAKDDWQVCGAARVCSTQPRLENWDVGCEFVEMLDEQVLDKLAMSAYLERRRDNRCIVRQPAVMRRESREERYCVSLEDLSMGGFCLSSATPVDVGERLLVELDYEADSLCFAARVQWQAQADDSILIGCTFLSAHSAHALNERIRPSETPPSPATRIRSRLTRIGWYGLIFAFLYCLIWALRNLLL